ncbi:TIM barrel protein [Chitinophaga sp. SYP-B3965]|uniref:sugar phosphate isomerase/epimerase family protein n=1 Tax=Chitinophaga sp. SYP-B3965 TaxID=2663120 RepID=UPI001299F1B4|nr:sugar phosphate isomerase/epimerase [Chitinophaga sp. SYP-B3965]MRG45257.1 TIM barrel protein [Chitinophaga sp. SYP-B3965]
MAKYIFFILVTMTFMAFSSGKPTWKTGVALYSFHQHSFEKGLDMAVDCGLKNVEGFSFQKLGNGFGGKTMIDLNKEELTLIKTMLKKRNLQMPSMYVDTKGRENWEKYFKLARELGMKYLVSEPAKNEWNMIDQLAGIYKIKVAIHEHAKPSPYWHPDSVLAAIKGHKNIGACADLGHWVRSGLDPVRCLQLLDGHIIGIHLKDVDRSGNDVDLGTGAIDFTGVVKELKKQQFSGFIQAECEHNMDNNSLDVKRSVEYINNIAEKN